MIFPNFIHESKPREIPLPQVTGQTLGNLLDLLGLQVYN